MFSKYSDWKYIPSLALRWFSGGLTYAFYAICIFFSATWWMTWETCWPQHCFILMSWPSIVFLFCLRSKKWGFCCFSLFEANSGANQSIGIAGWSDSRHCWPVVPAAAFGERLQELARASSGQRKVGLGPTERAGLGDGQVRWWWHMPLPNREAQDIWRSWGICGTGL